MLQAAAEKKLEGPSPEQYWAAKRASGGRGSTPPLKAVPPSASGAPPPADEFRVTETHCPTHTKSPAYHLDMPPSTQIPDFGPDRDDVGAPLPRTMRLPHTQAELKELWAQLDPDGDGYVSMTRLAVCVFA